MTKAALVLTGAGSLDGSNVHEATLLAYYLDKAGIDVAYVAPDLAIEDVVNHHSLSVEGFARNAMVEASRIARGPVTALHHVDASAFDALIVCGGKGVQRLLVSKEKSGVGLNVLSDLQSLCVAMHQQKRPMGFVGVSSMIAATLIKGTMLTRGTDQEALEELEAMGAVAHQACADDVIYDHKNKVYSTPGFEVDSDSFSMLAKGLELLVDAVKNEFVS